MKRSEFKSYDDLPLFLNKEKFIQWVGANIKGGEK